MLRKNKCKIYWWKIFQGCGWCFTKDMRDKIFNVFDTQISTAKNLVGNDATAREKYQNKYRKRNISNQFRATT